MYYNRIFPLPDLLGSGVYAGASAEVGRISDRFDSLPSPGTLWSGSLFLGRRHVRRPGLPRRRLRPPGNWSLYMLLGAPSGPRTRARHPTSPAGSPRGLVAMPPDQPPGGRYAIACFAASSTSATVISTTVFTDAPPA